MEKDTERNMYVYDDEGIGTVKIANDVVAMIAGLAAKEVEGVSDLAGNVGNEIMGMVGMKKNNKGVKVEVTGKHVIANVSVFMEYGYNIPATSKKVQEKIKTAIENMTGLQVEDVNVSIVGVDMKN